MTAERPEMSEAVFSEVPELSMRELCELGTETYRSGDPAGALPYFRRAHDRNSNDARVRSYYGLCLGLSERCFEESVELCQSAAKQEFFNPELYLNLSKLYLGFGFKSEGIRYLRRGLMIDPGNVALAGLLRDLGDRLSPVIGFLPRRHPVNRWLGTARSILIARGSAARIAA